ncbi:family 10 glycosylhydrolase (plasmid) [Photobacterium sp. DA100]|uniref:glycoside hydrolase family 10 protein n=1 Tax=Photobacterium sp. DA100 TaxID=3027472 RepID=UPI00247B11F5|nr:family 10 glycosylhydrolase [Photobacterium sp. DA100]WEM44630.1 family 10 glycosylhydrolase [Photobacterium sp. DA100]
MLLKRWMPKARALIIMGAVAIVGCNSSNEEGGREDEITTTGKHAYFLNQERDTNELIVYDPDFGETTETNQFGYEVTVEDGIITRLGGADSAIPDNGFVLSGHGTASSFLTEYSIVGTHVELDEDSMQVILHTDLNSYRFQAEMAISDAADSIASAYQGYYDFPKELAERYLGQAKDDLAAGDEARIHSASSAYELYLSASRNADSAYYHTIESEVVEQRGIWHRPEEKNLGEVIETVQGMHKTGFNSIYLEVTFWGYTIYPSQVMADYGMTIQHPHFSDKNYGPYGNDILAAYIGEAAKLGMTVQGWTNGFMIGSPNLVEPIPPQIAVNPHWLAIQNSNVDEEIIPDNRYGYFWLDIVQDDVQDYMLEIFHEMQEKYAITGLNIDYMRYPHYEHADSFSFNSRALAQYQEESGIEDTEILRTDAEAFAEYQEWIRDRENIFIKKLADQAKGVNPDFMFTATPEPGPEEVLIADWQDDIDGVIPQAYGHDFDSIHNHVNASKKLMPEGTIYYTGIYSFYHMLDAMGTVQDVLAGRYQTSGVNMFAYGQGKQLPGAREALSQGPWREPAFNPGEHLMDGVALLLNDVEDKFTTIYIPRGAISESAGNAIVAEVQHLAMLIESGQFVLNSEFEQLISAIAILAENQELDSGLAHRLENRLLNAAYWNNHARRNQQRVIVSRD